MRSRVDTMRTNHLSASTTNTRIHASSSLVRSLLLEVDNMRVLLFTLPLVAAACVDTYRPPHSTDGGSDDGNCASVEHDLSVRSEADVADLPTGCWDLYGKLSVNGSAVTSLAMLGDIRSANDIEIVG